MSAAPETVAQPLRLDLGAGKNPKQGFVGVDRIDFGNGNQVVDLTKIDHDWHRADGGIPFLAWPWETSSVDEVHCSHFVEHLNARERVHFCNQLYRVLKPGAKAQIIVPHGASGRAFGDMTHQWPPVHEFWFYYLDRAWRKVNAPHDDSEFSPDGYDCDFAATWGYNLHPSLLVRSSDYQQHAIQFWREAIQDLVATFEARK